MVQGISSSQNMGTIKKVGTTENRTVYEVTTPEGQVAGRLAVANKDCDRFEKAYTDIMEVAPKIQEWTEKHSSPKETERRRKAGKFVKFTSIAACMAYPLFKGFEGNLGWLKGLALTIAGFVGGSIIGSLGAGKITNPPGTMKLAKASQELSKVDAVPVE